MKKILLILFLLILLAGICGAYILFGPATGFSERKAALYIRTNAATKAAVLDSLQRNHIIRNASWFELLATRMHYWERVKPGKYDIEKGSSLVSIIRQLRNGQQSPVNLTITKLRTKEDLAKLVGRKLETDSATMRAYLEENAFMEKHGFNAEESMAFVLPDTYTYFWNSSAEQVYRKFVDATLDFWNDERKSKAEKRGMTPLQIQIIASIVEEETNAQAEKGNIASVYMNRIRRGMPLQADPTVKFALKDFSLRRIYHKHLQVASPYNTYRNKGLPPGPICTPSRKTIDAVLDAPDTEYLYFVASPQFNGTHDFSATYEEHLRKAREYQQALNKLQASRNQN